MTVTLTSEQEKFIREQVESGHFQSADEIIAQSLGMLRAQEEFISSSKIELRKQIGVGLEQIRRGEMVDGRQAIQAARERLQNRKRDGE
jgi:antitoxin ParD1/3/4